MHSSLVGQRGWYGKEERRKREKGKENIKKRGFAKYAICKYICKVPATPSVEPSVKPPDTQDGVIQSPVCGISSGGGMSAIVLTQLCDSQLSRVEQFVVM